MDTINICIAINDTFIIPAVVMLQSLFSKTDSPIQVYLLYNSLSLKNKNKIEKITVQHGNRLNKLYVSDEYFKKASLNHNPKYSIEIYYRILIPYIIPEDKVLWLDGDIIVQGNIADLYRTDISDYYCAACIDIGEESRNRVDIKDRMGISAQVYFNSGVLLLNSGKIRREIALSSFLQVIQKYNDILICPDQDILNYVLGIKALIMPNSMNYQHHLNSLPSSDCLILHYIWMKPWDYKYNGMCETFYWDQAVECGFLLEYIKYRIKRFLYLFKTEYCKAIIGRISFWK